MSRTTLVYVGDWYTGNAQKLDHELSTWLTAVETPQEGYPVQGCKAIIAPHAGYSYSGPAAAYAYKAIDTTGITRVFILGPSHHYYLEGCALSLCSQYETPIGSLSLDLKTISELRATGKFEDMSLADDEAEHSIEMHLPYVRKVFEGKDIAIVPILVGAVSQSVESAFGAVLAPYLSQPDTVFVISSDFCHWGTRFSYTYYYPEPAPSAAQAFRLSRSTSPSPTFPIYQSITRLDQEAMEILSLPLRDAATAHDDFDQYLKKTKNTICGRHPIGVLLGALAVLEGQGRKATIAWVRYEQSSHCRNIQDSSVSYASAWTKV